MLFITLAPSTGHGEYSFGSATSGVGVGVGLDQRDGRRGGGQDQVVGEGRAGGGAYVIT